MLPHELPKGEPASGEPTNPKPPVNTGEAGARAYSEDELKKWWAAKCPECGWRGLSRDGVGGGQIADSGDYGDPKCPRCWAKGNEWFLEDDDEAPAQPSKDQREGA